MLSERSPTVSHVLTSSVGAHLADARSASLFGALASQLPLELRGNFVFWTGADIQQYPACSAAPRGVERLIDVIERKLVRNDALEGNTAGLNQPQDPRDVDVRSRIAAMGAGQHLVEVNRQSIDRHLLRGDPDQHAGSVRMREFVGKLDNRLGAGCFDDLIRSFDANDGTHLPRKVDAGSGLDSMSGAAFPRHRELAFQYIDGNDRIGACQTGELDDG